MAVRSNMHLGDMVIEVTKFSSEVRSDLRGHYHSCPLVFRAIALLFFSPLYIIHSTSVLLYIKKFPQSSKVSIAGGLEIFRGVGLDWGTAAGFFEEEWEQGRQSPPAAEGGGGGRGVAGGGRGQGVQQSAPTSLKQ